MKIAGKLREIEETDWVAEMEVPEIIDHAIDDIFELIEGDGVEIENNVLDDIGRVKGDYSLNTLFSQILKTRIRTAKSGEIKINAEKDQNSILLIIEDNGESLPEDIKNLISGEVYKGKTTGSANVLYYTISEIAEHNNANIEVRDSELGGAKFDIFLEKA